MTTPLKTIATKYSKYLTPKRLLFRSSDNLQSLGQVREVFKQLGKYGEMAEYKVMRCPETFQYLNYGFIVYKNSQDADKAMKDKFIKIQPSDVFNEPFEISL
ncbi:hypothetical protein BDF20DRAFT_808104, partial [Mycotypha africana]|uniref:uncharacterized protein n=1 Tax=Mycotypha africana TaxID=64632 RepID=UPI00230001E9